MSGSLFVLPQIRGVDTCSIAATGVSHGLPFVVSIDRMTQPGLGFRENRRRGPDLSPGVRKNMMDSMYRSLDGLSNIFAE